VETVGSDVTPPRRHGPRRLLPDRSPAARGWDAAAAWVERHAALTDRWLIPAVLFGAAWLAYAWLNRGQTANLAYFVPLADALLHGRLGLTEGPKWLNELVPAANGLFYVVYPPMPALVVLPVVALFGPGFHQEWASIVLGAANVVLVSLVFRRMGVPRGTRFLLSLVFAFGSVVWYSAQAGSSWHFAHVVATLFLLLTILGCQGDAPTWLIGLAFAGAALSRLPVAMAVPFLAAYLADRAIRSETGDRTPFGALAGGAGAIRRPPIRQVIRLGVPMAVGVAVPLAAYLAYDQLRFGSPFENGYALIPGLLSESQYRYGFFSIHNIPRQLFAMFLNTPVQVGDFPWVRPRLLGGLSILLTTPLFIWVVKARDHDWFTVGAWVSVALILVPVLTHADPGGAQWGYRYAQDIYPFLWLLTVRGLRGRIGFEAGLAIALGFVVNLWGMAISYTSGWA
jgi:hypothetical protein